ncbi:hypothetical protein LX36DRAFT_27207 [Colletotrichum falcatum]|nr:hypothetical protein LX36DRAFT_27207 [Colletotrichum falcatum]
MGRRETCAGRDLPSSSHYRARMKMDGSGPSSGSLPPRHPTSLPSPAHVRIHTGRRRSPTRKLLPKVQPQPPPDATPREGREPENSPGASKRTGICFERCFHLGSRAPAGVSLENWPNPAGWLVGQSTTHTTM